PVRRRAASRWLRPFALGEHALQRRGRIPRRREPRDPRGEHDRLAQLVLGQPGREGRAQVLGELRGTAERRERHDRAELAVAIGQRGAGVQIAVHERDDVPTEVAEPFDGAQRFLVMDLEEPLPPSVVALIPLVHRKNRSAGNADRSGPSAEDGPDGWGHTGASARFEAGGGEPWGPRARASAARSRPSTIPSTSSSRSSVWKRCRAMETTLYGCCSRGARSRRS